MSTAVEHSGPAPESPFDLLCYYAEAMAADSLQDERQAANTGYFLFAAGGAFFMLRVDDVRSVIRELPLITKLPFSPPWLLGLSNVRSEIVTVVSLADLLAKERAEGVAEYHYILLGRAGAGYMLRVDELYGISSLEGALVEVDKDVVDGECSADGKVWQRINVAALLQHKLNIDVTKLN